MLPMHGLRRLDRPLLRLVFVALLSFTALAVCSKSSFLYPMNNGVDVNCFFTVGRGIVHGLMPYRDLYEQKGPLLYLLYALASLVSENSFLGVYLLEGLCFSCFLHLSGRIAQTVTGSRVIYWPTAAVMALAVPLSGAFTHGSSAEECFLPVMALGLWLVLRALREDRPLGDGEGFVLGLCTAAALWTKYTFCGLFAGLALAVMIRYLATGRAGRLPRLIGFFLLGLAALSGAVVGWFALRGALGDLWQVYFIDNLTKYPRSVSPGRLLLLPLKIAWRNLTWCPLAALGLIWIAVCRKEHAREAPAVWLSALCLFASTYFGGRDYIYYGLVFAVFSPLGLAAAGALARQFLPGSCAFLTKPGRLTRTALAAALVLLLLNPLLALGLCGNTYMLGLPMEATPYGQFAQIIRQQEDRSLLNYGFLDGGFYFAAGQQTPDRYFCLLNLTNPDMEAGQEACVAEKRTAFVVVRGRSDFSPEEQNRFWRQMADNPDYRLVRQMEWVIERRYVYALYQRVDAVPPEAPAFPLDAPIPSL